MVEDILRFADKHGLHGLKEAQLIAFVRQVRAVRASRRKAKWEQVGRSE